MIHVRRPSAASIIAFVALFATLGGSAYAAKKITSKDIANGTIKVADLSGSAKKALKGQRGPAGPRGATGLAGPAGPSLLGAMTTVTSAQVPFGNDIVVAAAAFCPAGQRVISGGGVSISDEEIAASEPTAGRTGWFVIGVDLIEDGGTSYVQATANCAPAGRAVAASVHTRKSERRGIARVVAKVKAQADAKK